jgi:hypothetical protein
MIGAFQKGPFQPKPAYQQEEDEEEVFGGGAPMMVLRHRPRRDNTKLVLGAIQAFLSKQ